jgi:chitin-binding protein
VSHRFPEGLREYKAGTRVLQPKDGRVYECRPWPNAGYCVQWSQHANQFEPGVGSHWQEAWIAR